MSYLTKPESKRRPRTAAAEYIAMEASRLARMASANEFPLLAYVMDMAVLEAWRQASEPESGGTAEAAAGSGDSPPRRSDVA